MLPIQIIEPKLGHFGFAQAINSKEHQNGAIAQIPRTIGVRGGKHTLDIGPIWAGWERFFGVHTRRLDCICQVEWTPALGGAVAKESPECSCHIPNRSAAPSPGATLGQVQVNIDNLRFRQWPPLGAIPAQELCDVSLLAADRHLSQTPLGPHPMAMLFELLLER